MNQNTSNASILDDFFSDDLFGNNTATVIQAPKTEAKPDKRQEKVVDFETALHQNAPLSAKQPKPVETKELQLNQGIGHSENILKGMTIAEIDKLAASGRTKLSAIQTELSQYFVEREDVIKDAVRALVSGQHMLLLGPPGTGKSALVRSLCDRIEQSVYFEWLLNRTSDPSEILGPLSVRAMEQDQFIRKTDGKLPSANIAFIDEIFKSNEPTLNILLPLLNEKVFFNDGVAVPVPLLSLFGASNEEPEDDGLGALYDRILFRHYVDYVRDAGNRLRMRENFLSSRSGLMSFFTTKITLMELEALKQSSKSIMVGKKTHQVFDSLVRELDKTGVVISDRRQNICMTVLQANAAIKGRTQVTSDDFDALKSILWTNKEDIPKINALIEKMVNPYDAQIADVVRKANEVKQGIINAKSDSDRISMIMEAQTNLQTQMKRLDKTIDAANKDGRDVTEMIAVKNEWTGYIQQIVQQHLGIPGFTMPK